MRTGTHRARRARTHCAGPGHCDGPGPTLIQVRAAGAGHPRGLRSPLLCSETACRRGRPGLGPGRPGTVPVFRVAPPLLTLPSERRRGAQGCCGTRTGPLSPTVPSESECAGEPERGRDVALAVTAFLPWPGGPNRSQPGGCVGGASDQRHPVSGSSGCGRDRRSQAFRRQPTTAAHRRTGLEDEGLTLIPGSVSAC